MWDSHCADLKLNFSSQTEFRYIYILDLIKTGKLFSSCSGCASVRMSAVPQGAFAARKVRQQWQLQLMVTEETGPNNGKGFYDFKPQNMAEAAMEQPMQYSSKLMNSIWGLYNRYSVHNFKKNTDGKMALQGNELVTTGLFQ